MFLPAYAVGPYSVPPPNYKVAFIADQGVSIKARSVLQLIRNEGAVMVLHQGDLGYDENSVESVANWDNQINDILGSDFPYFASIGNHDRRQWSGYQQKLQERLERIEGETCTGNLGVKSGCHYNGLFFILVGPHLPQSWLIPLFIPSPFIASNEAADYIKRQLAQDSSLWRICSWHHNQKKMQVGAKPDDVGWEPYEECRKGGAIIATGHEHSYSRTKTLINTQAQTVDPDWPDHDNLWVARGSTFVFVSGLGGSSIRDQIRCLPASYPYGCKGEWAKIYTNNQGAQYGALFITFHVDGNPNKARGYFKNIDGQIIDTFEISSARAQDPALPMAATGRTWE